MVQKKVTESFPKRRLTVTKRTAEKRKLGKSKESNLSDTEESFFDQLPNIDAGSLETFRKALDTSSPETLPGREAQIAEVYEFISEHLQGKEPGSLYISGAPGTGKTAVVKFVIDKIIKEKEAARRKLGFYHLFVNCMCKRAATDIYELVLEKLKTARESKKSAGSLKDRVKDKLLTKTKASNMIVVVLDEMDQIMKGSNEVLYSLFEWARSPNSRLILIGVANALDLTVRHLPFLHLNSSPEKLARSANGTPMPIQNMCRTMSFPPYLREDIEKIIQERMEQAGQNIFASAAIKFVASKVAASTGDARKALHACKEAMVTVEKQERASAVKPAEHDENVMCSPSLSPRKVCVRNDQIGVLAVSKVLQQRKDEGPLPLQQMTILAALLKLNQDAPNTRDPMADGVNKPVPISLVYKQYRKICSLKGLSSWIEESELPSICEVLQDRSLVSLINSANSTTKKLSFGNKKFGSPSTSANNKIGLMFDPRLIEGLVLQGEMKTLFG